VLEGKAAAPNAANVREEQFADGEAKPARRAPAKKPAAAEATTEAEAADKTDA